LRRRKKRKKKKTDDDDVKERDAGVQTSEGRGGGCNVKW
jgi:hypothetical protein